MKFENGKFYRHTTGDLLAIVGVANTTFYNECLVGETLDGGILAIGTTEAAAVNFVEISKIEWLQGFNARQAALRAIEKIQNKSEPTAPYKM